MNSKNKSRVPDIKFISYDGEFPNLCSGVLILEIDGERIQFGTHYFNDEYKEYSETGRVNGIRCFTKFWRSGGNVWFDDDWSDHVEDGEWELNEDDLPKFLKPFGQQLIDIFNENVTNGCCGGCV